MRDSNNIYNNNNNNDKKIIIMKTAPSYKKSQWSRSPKPINRKWAGPILF